MSDAPRERPESEGRSTRGAVYVEFLISFMPLFCFNLCLVQFAYLQSASIIVKNATALTTRAAIVIIHDDPKYYGGVPVGQVTGQRKADIERAAELALKPLHLDPGDFSVEMASSYGRDDLVEIKLWVAYGCRVPFARYVVCSGFGGDVANYGPPSIWTNGGVQKKLLHGEAALPNQGADYTY